MEGFSTVSLHITFPALHNIESIWAHLLGESSYGQYQYTNH